MGHYYMADRWAKAYRRPSYVPAKLIKRLGAKSLIEINGKRYAVLNRCIVPSNQIFW